MQTKVILVVLDGWGWTPIPQGNLLFETDTPGLDTLLGLGKWVLVRTASLEVGLPWGSVGDSELGHYNMGTGRIVLSHNQDHLVAALSREAVLAAPTPAETEAITEFDDLQTPSSLASLVSSYGWRQLKIAHTDKLGVLTGAFNGYPAHPITDETSIGVDDETALATTLRDQLAETQATLTVINLSGADRAAHTKELSRVRGAIERIDQQLRSLAEIARDAGAVLYLIADHGNIEQMIDQFGRPDASHTTAPVLLARIDLRGKHGLNWATHHKRKEHVAVATPAGLLADVTPTILDEFRLPVPEPMVGISLLRNLTK